MKGRRKYPTNAARQAAYRRRKKERERQAKEFIAARTNERWPGLTFSQVSRTEQEPGPELAPEIEPPGMLTPAEVGHELTRRFDPWNPRRDPDSEERTTTARALIAPSLGGPGRRHEPQRLGTPIKRTLKRRKPLYPWMEYL
jgi:hypothetical protein